ncbi:hypothetical protein OCS_02407 [Ophiocordyceps sinensis CO18]|uniref:Tat pathway signal sequence n=1 Tax=Ophiocordyceps sinensis (strain Co18 / CGMCC 3.14243) TaxID=911162 RepID=T5AJ73_OPHSC|nr:hypothetical protein OCS_02407 [Ophiocordyceps sinensis CO18]
MFSNNYTPIDQTSERGPSLDQSCDDAGQPTLQPWRRGYLTINRLLCAVVLCLATSNIVTLIFSTDLLPRQRRQSALNRYPAVQILGPADVPVEMEMREFHTGIAADQRTAFWGPPNNQTIAAWASILDVGLIHLNDQQAGRLGSPTARQYNTPPGSYVGVLEVFHQLHCLSRIWASYYTDISHDGESREMMQKHTAHCFDYLRQALMCNGDVNIGPIGWEETTETYIADLDGVKECRNFDRIHRWAKLHDVPNAPGNAAELGRVTKHE